MDNRQPTAHARPAALVTGVSSAIGAACAAGLARRGYRVFGTARRPTSDHLSIDGARIEMLALDVTDAASVDAAVAAVIARAGRIDVLVNNAGITVVGAAEEVSDAEARAVVETNFLGVHRMTRAVLPHMRERRSGRIITVGSVAGFLPKPFESFYSATKHAIEGYMESVHHEVRDLGIRVSIVEPGYVHTGFSDHAAGSERRIAAYGEQRAIIEQRLRDAVAAGMAPAGVAAAVVKAATSRFPRLRYRPGFQARRFAFEHWLAPQPILDLGVRVHYGLGTLLGLGGRAAQEPPRPTS